MNKVVVFQGIDTVRCVGRGLQYRISPGYAGLSGIPEMNRMDITVIICMGTASARAAKMGVKAPERLHCIYGALHLWSPLVAHTWLGGA